MSKKTNLQLKDSTKRLFTGSEVGVMLEDIDHKLGNIAEGYLMLNDKVDKLTDSHEKLSWKVDRMEVKLDAVATKLDATFEMVGEIKLEITENKHNVAQHNKRITSLEKAHV